MEGVIRGLLSMGTIGALFLAFLIIALVVLGHIVKSNMKANSDAITAYNVIMLDSMKAKDKRIELLETDVKEIHNYIKNELQEIIADNKRVMQKVLNHLDK